jgi:hypothetical protein
VTDLLHHEITSEAARRLDNDRPHTVALDPLQHGCEAGTAIDGIGTAHGSVVKLAHQVVPGSAKSGPNARHRLRLSGRPSLRIDPTLTQHGIWYSWVESSPSRARLALALLLYTGQRRGDVIRMGAQHVRGGTLYVKQEKTGAELAIPMHPDLGCQRPARFAVRGQRVPKRCGGRE